MLRLIFLTLLQASLVCSAQSLFKVAAGTLGDFCWSWSFFRDGILTNGMLWTAAVVGLVGLLEWLYMLKSYPFSVVDPLSSVSFLLGMFVAVFFFHETVAWTQWLGVLLILAGCGLIVR